ncbi:Glucose-repressible alcohol dehydrogenase transcriptional effector [Entophlyctis sp. JEL0112]|nr:Glucose-repressible alcohol dehydrogenase transcriptional effector [Entophlyctis sp. JEL0112]
MDLRDRDKDPRSLLLHGSGGGGGSLHGSVHSSLPFLSVTAGAAKAADRERERLAQSRMAASPHHHARIAAAAARTQNNASGSNLNLSFASTDDESSFSNGLPPAVVPPNTAGSSTVNPGAAKWTVLDIGGMHIRSLSPSIFNYAFLTTLYLNHNNLTQLHHDISRLRSLVVLDLSGNRISALPPEIGALISLKELLLFDNQISYLPVELGALFQLELLGLEGNPLSDPYATIAQKDGSLAIVSYLRELIPVISTGAFTVFCYNTLCDKYATAQTYAYTPAWALAWDYRKDLIFGEILSYQADIVCLQEIETGQFEEFFQERLLEETDYQGVFWPKSRARTMGEYERRAVDGCATFFRTSKFSLVEKHTIEFQQIAMQRPELRRTEDVFNRVMVKDNIALISVLQSKAAPYFTLIVANTHLHWDPNECDVKLVQAAMLVEELGRVVSLHTSGDSAPAVLVCGDFNSLPGSGVHKLLSEGNVARDHEDFKKYTYGAYTREGVSHTFDLASAYASIGELDFTNFTPGFRGVIDYIWYTRNSLAVTHVLGNVDREYVNGRRNGVVGFPNAHHPSDHVPIMAAMVYTGNQNGKTNVVGGIGKRNHHRRPEHRSEYQDRNGLMRASYPGPWFGAIRLKLILTSENTDFLPHAQLADAIIAEDPQSEFADADLADSDPTIAKLIAAYERLVDAHAGMAVRVAIIEAMRANLVNGKDIDGSDKCAAGAALDVDEFLSRFEGVDDASALSKILQSFAQYFEAKVLEEEKLWAAKTREEKYNKNPAYRDMRRKLWEVNHKSPFFFDADSNGEDDTDVAVVGQQKSNKCPFSGLLMHKAYTNPACNHSYSDAIFASFGNSNQIECPVAGCNKYVAKNQLVRDKNIERLVRRQIQKEQHEKERKKDVAVDVE